MDENVKSKMKQPYLRMKQSGTVFYNADRSSEQFQIT
jgi:hypothetical protein